MRFLRLLAWCFLTTGVGLAGLGAVGYWLYRNAESRGPLSEAHTVVVPAHSGIAAISELLAEQGAIRHQLVFQFVAKLSGRGTALKPGEYEIPAGASVMQTLDLLASGKTVRHRLTIPEGLTSTEIIELVRNAPVLDGGTGPMPADGDVGGAPTHPKNPGGGPHRGGAGGRRGADARRW